MKTIFFAAIASFLLLSTASFALDSADKITFLGVEVQLGEVSHSTLTITFDQNSAVKEFSLPLFYNIHNLKSDSNFGNASCSQQKKPFGSQIDCEVFPTQEKRMLKLEYDSFDLVRKIDKQFLYKQEFHMPIETKQLSFKTMLPEGMFLTSEGVFQQFLPINGEKGSDGRRIFVSWRKENLIAGESFDTQISYESQSDNGAMMALFTGSIIGLAVLIVALILGFWLFFKRSKKSIKVVLPVLKSDEKAIMERILKDKGKSNQKLLVRESNYSKAKVSKLLKSLQERGLIRLERVGRNNNVYLEKDFNKGKKEEKQAEENSEEQNEGTSGKGAQSQKAQKKRYDSKAGNYIPLREIKNSEPDSAEDSEYEKGENSE